MTDGASADVRLDLMHCRRAAGGDGMVCLRCAGVHLRVLTWPRLLMARVSCELPSACLMADALPRCGVGWRRLYRTNWVDRSGEGKVLTCWSGGM